MSSFMANRKSAGTAGFAAPNWLLLLAYAADLSTGQPQAIMDRAEQKTAMYREMLEGWDVEDASTSFAPDSRSQYYGNRFR